MFFLPGSNQTISMNEQIAPNRRYFYYWIAPLFIGSLLVGMYFSGISWMSSFVAPEINREFGALETLEHLTIFAIMVVAVRGICRKTKKWERVLFAGAFVGALFLFLEELDYGIHFIEYFSGEKYEEGPRNIHNYILNPYGLDFDAVLSPIVYFVLGFYFCLLPLMLMDSTKPLWRFLKLESFVERLSANPWLRYLVPEPHSMGTIAAMVLVAQVAYFLDKIKVPNNLMLQGNISEFGEFFVHYLILLYMVEMVYNRKAPDSEPGDSGLDVS